MGGMWVVNDVYVDGDYGQEGIGRKVVEGGKGLGCVSGVVGI